jgi:hypothetical protein
LAFEGMLMQIIRKAATALCLVIAMLTAPLQAPAAGVTDTEIRIGNIMPYTGPLAAFASIGRAEAAYFDMINERGGINGRKVKFISRDDSSNPDPFDDADRRDKFADCCRGTLDVGAADRLHDRLDRLDEQESLAFLEQPLALAGQTAEIRRGRGTVSGPSGMADQNRSAQARVAEAR